VKAFVRSAEAFFHLVEAFVCSLEAVFFCSVKAFFYPLKALSVQFYCLSPNKSRGYYSNFVNFSEKAKNFFLFVRIVRALNNGRGHYSELK
jgi:predicted GNAT superfamily acetyltransferase